MQDVASSNQLEPIRVGQLTIRYLQHSAENTQLGCFELRVPAGSNVPPPHAHGASEELLVVLEGCLRVTVGSVTRDLRAGECIATPAGVPHGFANPHSEEARALVVNSPDIGVEYFREMAALVNAPGGPDRAQVAATMRRFGIVPAPMAPAARG
jgi:mannose-6-phosphate isomerase-like protein (cupin superfamily)